MLEPVSNAGAASRGAFLSADLDAERRIVRLNTTAHLDLTNHFAQRLASRGRGGILLVSALGAVYGVPYMANATATMPAGRHAFPPLPRILNTRRYR